MTAFLDVLREQIKILDERIAAEREQGRHAAHLVKRRAEVAEKLADAEKKQP